MKNILTIFFLILFTGQVMGQAMTTTDPNQKSKNQRTWAWLLTGGGAAMAIGGIALTASDPDYFPGWIGPAMIGAGAGMIGGGIILFSAAKRNAAGSTNTSFLLNFKLEQQKQIKSLQIGQTFYPALSFQLRF
ncbi:hypothetical protein KJS94_07570 [Flavihumibacter rivuli]|uniref:hypothetical protein n=1 Tax=Flavihumibacter rivuli TaxID=2838156 RepID=UPI001BDECE4B|nr:hypothetical protein [Flavihumibacter rivuli]ULQ58059.1 hypothetical protein KJS94_07570 [Flavihumibacter rivuli]